MIPKNFNLVPSVNLSWDNFVWRKILKSIVMTNVTNMKRNIFCYKKRRLFWNTLGTLSSEEVFLNAILISHLSQFPYFPYKSLQDKKQTKISKPKNTLICNNKRPVTEDKELLGEFLFDFVLHKVETPAAFLNI